MSVNVMMVYRETVYILDWGMDATVIDTVLFVSHSTIMKCFDT